MTVAALAVAAAAVVPAFPNATPAVLAMGAGGGALGGLAALAFALAPKRAPGDFERDLELAVARWRQRDGSALEGLVAEAVGPESAAHALRVTTLCDLLAEQLAIGPEEAQDLRLAGALHVLPLRHGKGAESGWGCAHSPRTLAGEAALVGRFVCAGAGEMLAQSRERWDGSGLPAALLREESCLGARVLAVACAFDAASASSLDDALALIRAGSALEFDPVVAGELLHLFRQPWQQRQAA